MANFFSRWLVAACLLGISYVGTCVSFGASSLMHVTSFALSTGEILIGEVVSRNKDFVEIRNSYSTVKIPTNLIVNESIVETYASVHVPSEPPPPDDDHEYDDSNAWRPFFGSEKSVVGRNDPFYAYLKSARDAYREFLDSVVPEGMKFNFSLGITSEITTIRKNRYYFSASMEREWDTMNFSLSGFYDYEWQRSENGVESVNTDKYGASGNYKWHFLGADSNWYFTIVAAYRHDTLKMINYQIDESVGVGYNFEIPTWGLKWSVSIGPGCRYIDALDYNRHMIPMIFLNETLTWDLTDLLRLEHTGYFGMDATTGEQGTAYVMLGLVFMPKGVFSLAFRLTNDFDTINSSLAIKNEQKLILSLEIPIQRSESED